MKKIHLLGPALIAVFVFGAIIAASAMAEVPLWLKNGEEVVENQVSISEGELILTDLKPLGLSASSVLCSGKFIGTVGSEGKGEISEVLDLVNGGPYGGLEELTGTPFTGCTVVTGACSNEVKVWPEHLPWKTQLELNAEGAFLEVVSEEPGEGLPAYDLECKTVIGKFSDLCEGATFFLLTNGVTDVIKSITHEELELANALAFCTASNGHTSGMETEGEDLLSLTSGATLSVSEP